ncbi:MarR family transcriptional regulator [Noviherbaspirillum saxi]|uniref:MarR family transcriptional regulator n=1 Tax=Noviherbaspirillum saxi TaxID=2320863 RepID=A0A3A3FMB8_9BURK|nr:MarR family transcriptional regulator [Noviherbaspirillum saxi]
MFFKMAHRRWMEPDTQPTVPLQQWTVSESGLDPDLIDNTVPIIFGSAGFHFDRTNASLGLDVFGSAFFMLSRYEEAVNMQRDQHDRFPAHASLAFREHLLRRPIIDEYVEILWAAIKLLWPQITRRVHRYQTIVSCDVDQPYHPAAKSFRRMARATLGSAVRNRPLTEMFKPARNYLNSRRGDFQHDPYYFTVDWMMDRNEDAGNVVTFNFLPEVTDPAFDDTCAITDPAVIAMLKRIHARRHEIGLHPGYHTYQSIEKTLHGLNKLQEVLRCAGVEQSITGGRNHFLRWSTKTPAVWDATGLRYDSTLSYADHIGFRCGTCREYSMYDLHRRQPLRIKQRPLICMDCSIIVYMGYGLTEKTLSEIGTLKSATKKFHGNFTLLWHNSSLEGERARDLYCEIIK